MDYPLKYYKREAVDLCNLPPDPGGVAHGTLAKLADVPLTTGIER